MPAVIINHQVQDFAHWLKEFEAHAPVRKAAGFSQTAVWQASGDPNHVYIYMQGEDLARMQAFGQSPELIERMKAGGVTSVPQIQLLEGGHSFPH